MAYRYVDTAFLHQIERLDFRPRRYVGGWLPGRHRSPIRGMSVEFAEHRAYVPGDDPKQIDWRVYARQDRYVVRLHEGEVRASVHLLLDTSASMNYGDKFAFAARLALGLAYLVLKQQDSVSLWPLTEGPLVPPGSGLAQFYRLVRAIEDLTPGGRHRMSEALQEAIRRVPKHGVWLIFSDCLEPLEALGPAFQRLRFYGHEASLWHLLHPDERELPLEGPTEFIGYEGGRFRLQPELFRHTYRAYVREFCDQLRALCHQALIEYVAPDLTRTPLEVLTDYLTRRLHRFPSP